MAHNSHSSLLKFIYVLTICYSLPNKCDQHQFLCKVNFNIISAYKNEVRKMQKF